VLTIAGPVGSNYQIDYANALGDTNIWLPLTNIALPMSPYSYIDTQTPLSIRHFYRVTLVPLLSRAPRFQIVEAPNKHIHFFSGVQNPPVIRWDKSGG
jgi:hypothetical protein